MICEVCGTELDEKALICPKCGRAVVQAEPTHDANFSEKPMTKKAFLELPGMKSCKVNIKSCGIALYICAAITAIASILLSDVLLASLLDAFFLVVFGLAIQFGRSRVASIIVLLYGLLSMVITVSETGQMQGWWIPLVGAFAVYYTFQFHSAWKKYKKDGTIPPEVKVKAKKK